MGSVVQGGNYRLQLKSQGLLSYLNEWSRAKFLWPPLCPTHQPPKHFVGQERSFTPEVQTQ